LAIPLTFSGRGAATSGRNSRVTCAAPVPTLSAPPGATATATNGERDDDRTSPGRAD